MVRLFGALLASLALVKPVAGQANYPDRTIRIIQAFGPGGTPDILARLIGERLTEVWGKPVVVESITGAAGNIAADRVAKSLPDGYTLFLSANAAIAINQSLYKRLPYDPLRDLVPITQIAIQTNVLTVNNNVPANSVQELVDLA